MAPAVSIVFFIPIFASKLSLLLTFFMCSFDDQLIAVSSLHCLLTEQCGCYCDSFFSEGILLMRLLYIQHNLVTTQKTTQFHIVLLCLYLADLKVILQKTIQCAFNCEEFMKKLVSMLIHRYEQIVTQ